MDDGRIRRKNPYNLFSSIIRKFNCIPEKFVKRETGFEPATLSLEIRKYDEGVWRKISSEENVLA